MKNDCYHQLSRDKFFKEYDQNTEYFHATASNRKSINAINSLREPSGLWLSDRDQINSLLVNHFQQIGSSQNSNFDFDLSTIINPCISFEENNSLTLIPSKEEIWLTLSNMNQWGASGPDGFQPGFFKANWNILGKDIICSVQEFFRSGILYKDFNHSFITLIPKISTPQTPGDFRPISLSNTIYKIISKILANRLKLILGKLISPSQSSFLPGWQITDNIIIAHELIHSMKTSKKKKGFLALKLDLSKAFDRVEWTFIEKVLLAFGFSKNWTKLILQCISTTSFSILLNGSPGPTFKTSRGLRQGDPLSPYLFLICMEILSRLLEKAIEEKRISGFQINNMAPNISHLFSLTTVSYSPAKWLTFKNQMSTSAQKFIRNMGRF